MSCGRTRATDGGGQGDQKKARGSTVQAWLLARTQPIRKAAAHEVAATQLERHPTYTWEAGRCTPSAHSGQPTMLAG